MESNVHLSNTDGLGLIVLDRPERRNAIDGRTCRELIAAFKQADNNPGIRAILVRSEGSAFCAGLDLDEAASVDSGDGLDRLFADLFGMQGEMRKPIVGAVQGCAYGGGLGLVSLCHFVVASDEATFALPEINFGMWPYLVFESIVGIVGFPAALRMSLLGSPVSAAQAMQLGLVFDMVRQSDLAPAATNVAARLAQQDPFAVTLAMDWSRQRYRSRNDEMRESAIAARQLTKKSQRFIDFMDARRSRICLSRR